MSLDLFFSTSPGCLSKLVLDEIKNVRNQQIHWSRTVDLSSSYSELLTFIVFYCSHDAHFC